VPKRERMFPGITRQVVISNETHHLLARAAAREHKYIGELADELICQALDKGRQKSREARGTTPQHPPTERSTPTNLAPPVTTVERLALNAPRPYYKCHCCVCDREWVVMENAAAAGEDFTPPKRCNYADCRAYVWNDPVAALAARRKREQRLGRQS
jgi:hypothetical protein